MRPARLAVVDDSTFVRKVIERMFSGDSRVEVVGTASSGEELLAELERWRPDVISLDLSMPGIGGLPTLDRIMAIRPTPVIILSTHAGRGAPQTIEALHRGAVDFIDKQEYSLFDLQALREVMAEKILAVTTSGGPAVVPTPRPGPRGASITPAASGAMSRPDVSQRPYEVLLVGASTGGPPAIERVLTDLGPHCSVPVLIVQHMPTGFTRAFAERLNAHLRMEVREAEDGGVLLPGNVRIARAGLHLRVQREGGHLVASLSDRPSDAPHRPSIDELFTSAASVVGAGAVAVLLTGMGRDGAQGMLRLAEAGAWTLVQDRRTSVVYGMPGAAVALAAVQEVLPLSAVGPRLRRLVMGEGDPEPQE